MLTVYLGGPAECFEYRSFVKEEYSDRLNLIDPIEINRKDNPILIPKDLKLLQNSDIHVSYMPKLSFGNIMEIVYSYRRPTPVYCICEVDWYREDFWLKYHVAKFFDNIVSCFEFILEEQIKK